MTNNDATRNRAKHCTYLRNGVMTLAVKPLVGILALLVLAAAIIAAWRAPAAFAVRFLYGFPALVPFAIYALRFSALITLSLLFVALLYTIGTPRKARAVERDLAAVFGIESSSFNCPFLVSCRPLNKGSAVKEYVFWSRWISLEQWSKPDTKKAILWALHAHSDDDFTHGNRPYTVVIHAASGAAPKEREVPQDPLFS